MVSTPQQDEPIGTERHPAARPANDMPRPRSRRGMRHRSRGRAWLMAALLLGIAGLLTITVLDDAGFQLVALIWGRTSAS